MSSAIFKRQLTALSVQIYDGSDTKVYFTLSNARYSFIDPCL